MDGAGKFVCVMDDAEKCVCVCVCKCVQWMMLDSNACVCLLVVRLAPLSI